jgi:hypothetical protein
MTSYPLTLRAGHLLVDRGTGLELIDTGSPISMPLPEIARRVVGEDVTRLIGCDELERVAFTLDLAENRMRLSSPARNRTAHPRELPLSRVMGVPVLTIGTPAGARPAFFDTGAPLCYGDPEELAGIEIIGERDDFHPLMGAFRTPVRLVELRVGMRRVTTVVGELPPALGMMLGLTGTRWIVGPSAFAGRRVRIELRADGGTLLDMPGPPRRPDVVPQFPEYFTTEFGSDLIRVRGGVPLMHGGQEEQDDGGVTLQADALVRANPEVAAMSADRVELFALGVFWAVLMDQAVYTYGREWYPGFRAATRFPKLRGPCPWGCQSHMTPALALAATGRIIRSDGRFPKPSDARISDMNRTMQWASDYLGEFERVGVLPPGVELWERIMADGDVGLGR